MNNDAKNKQCQICQSYLFEGEDDIVVCPECGAPHHRDCWQTVGKCGLEHLHGTAEQYNPAAETSNEDADANEQTKTCKKCGKTIENPNSHFCPHCGQPFEGIPHIFTMGGMPIMLDPLGGIHPKTEIEGIKAKTMGEFVGMSPNRFIPRFVRMSKDSKTSWNWAAFLFPSAWSFSKKMDVAGIMYLILAVASKLCFMPFNMQVNQLGDTSNMTYQAIADLVAANIGNFSAMSMLLCFIGSLLFFIPRIYCGMRGEWTYRNHCIDRIKKIEKGEIGQDLEREEAFIKYGGVGTFRMLLGLLGESYLPTLLAMLIL